MTARGKRRAKRGASPLDRSESLKEALKVRNTIVFIPLFQSFIGISYFPGATRFALAPGCYIRTFGA